LLGAWLLRDRRAKAAPAAADPEPALGPGLTSAAPAVMDEGARKKGALPASSADNPRADLHKELKDLGLL